MGKVLILCSLLFMRFSFSCANFKIVGSGVVPLRKGDVGVVFYVTVRNSCNQSYQVTGHMVKCWETITGEDPDFNTVKLVGGNMGELQTNETRNLSYIFPNLYPYNRAGECELAVCYGDAEHSSKELRVAVPFDTLLTGRTVPPLLRGFVSMRYVHKCRTMDEDPLEKCAPVNCPVKYSGHRNFFNHRLQRCQPVPACYPDPIKEMPDITYSPISNTCQRAEITDEDIRYLTASGGRCEDQMKSQTVPHLKNMRCHNGRLDAATGFCVCDDGWGSPPLDPDQFHPTTMIYHMCTIRVRTWATIYDHQFQARYVLVAIAAAIITMLMMCCPFCLLGAWEFYVVSPDASDGGYDEDGFRLFGKEQQDDDSDQDINVCLCDGDAPPSGEPCDFEGAIVCTKPIRPESAWGRTRISQERYFDEDDYSSVGSNDEEQEDGDKEDDADDSKVSSDDEEGDDDVESVH